MKIGFLKKILGSNLTDPFSPRVGTTSVVRCSFSKKIRVVRGIEGGNCGFCQTWTNPTVYVRTYDVNSSRDVSDVTCTARAWGSTWKGVTGGSHES